MSKRTCIPALLVVLVSLLTSVPAARAATNTYYFHGPGSPAASASFDTTAPSGSAPQTQSASPLANKDYAGDSLAAYWIGSYSGTLSGSLQLDWWWGSANATAALFGLGLDVTVFTDADPSTGSGTEVGSAFVTVQAGGAPQENVTLVPVAGSAARNLLVQAVPHYIDTGNAPLAVYDSTSYPGGFSLVATPTPPAVVFDTTQTLSFAPSTTVSPSFLGGEPQVSTERQLAGSQAGRVDNQRLFINWPLSSRSQTSQVARSLNDGDSYRLLLDLTTCPQRNRPNCGTGGGGDSMTEVNLVNGNLFFLDQEVVANEGLASSTDHGDTWPATRQFALTNPIAATDRQWLAWIDPSLVSVGPAQVEAFMSYHIPGAGEYVQGIDQNGTPIPQPAPQIAAVSQSGRLRVDNSNGPGRGWIYQPYRGGGGTAVGTAPGASYQDPLAWKSTQVTGDSATIFPWLDLDSHGNAFLAWVFNGRVYLSVSPIDDARNNPSAGGRPGTYWTKQADVTPPGVTSSVFPEVSAGDRGRIVLAFDGSTDCAPGVSDNCAPTAHWNTYAEVISDALAPVRGTPLSVVSGLVSHRVVHRGSICTSGTTCSGDRSLLDMIDVGVDADGRAGVVFTDNNNALAAPNHTDATKNGPFTMYAKETAGPALLANKPAIAVTVPQNGRASAAGDATWPNTAAGRNLPSLDITGTSLGLSADGSQLVAKIRLADASVAGMTRDLNTYNSSTTQSAARLQYAARFHTADDVYHLSMDFDPTRTPQVRFFAGKLDADDGVQNGTGTIVGSRLVADSGFTANGSIRNGILTIMAPASQFGLSAGAAVTGVSAFSLAGPREDDATTTLVVDSARTIDSSPPFDATLAPVQDPPATVSCGDPSVQQRRGWHSYNGHCRQVGGHGGSGDDLQMGFYGSSIDLVTASGPRGGSFTAAIDGGPGQVVDEYSAGTGWKYGVPVHLDAGKAGYHTVHIQVLNNSSDPTRNQVIVDGMTVYGGDGVGAPTTVRDVSTQVNGVATQLLGAEYVVMTTANTVDLNFVLESVPGTTLTVKDPTGKVVASGTVSNGVLALELGPNGIGAYTVDVRDTAAGEAAFTLWETVGGA